MRAEDRGDRVRGHVRLAGSVLAAGAADVTRWFWLVEKLSHLVLVPHKDGRLRYVPAKRTIAVTLDRDALRAELRAGIAVSDGERDPEVAKREAKKIFTPEKRPPLRLVVDERYAAAGLAVRAGLDTVDVEVELHEADDPATEATTRIGNGERIDGVLTDAASTDAILDVAGFMPAVPL
jgi:hypothetical protein